MGRMDREDPSAAIIHEMGAVFMVEVAAVWPHLLQNDLAEIERRGPQVSGVVLGHLVERVAAAQEAGRAPEACPGCGGRLWRTAVAGAPPARARRGLSAGAGDLPLCGVRAGLRPAGRAVGTGARRPLAGCSAGGLSGQHRTAL